MTQDIIEAPKGYKYEVVDDTTVRLVEDIKMINCITITKQGETVERKVNKKYAKIIAEDAFTYAIKDTCFIYLVDKEEWDK